MAPTQPIRCRHCDAPIRPCSCDCAHGRPHWEEVRAFKGMGNLHCSGMPHQLHEPGDGNG